MLSRVWSTGINKNNLESSSLETVNRIVVTKDVDGAEISRFLQILENAVTDCQTQIGAAVNTAAPDHLRYSAAVDTLAAEIEAIKSDIARLQDAAADSAAKKLRAGGGPRAGGGIDPDLTSLTVRLNALQKLAALLESVLQIRSLLIQFDNALDSAHLDIASDALQTASKILETVSLHLEQATDANASQSLRKPSSIASQALPSSAVAYKEDDLYLLSYLKSQIVYRKSQLSRLVSLRLDQLISFFAHGVEVSLTSPTKDASMPPLTLEQLWHALKGTSSFTEKLKNIVTTLIEMLIDPIAVMVFQLPRNRVITSRTLTTGRESLRNSALDKDQPVDIKGTTSAFQQPCNLNAPSSAVWTWIESPSTSAETEKESPSDTARPIFLFLNVLESLFEFIAQHFFPGHPDLLEQLGSLLWPDLAEFLKDCLGKEDVEPVVLDRLRDFETRLKALYIIKFETKTLTTFCNRHEQVVFTARRRQLLSEVRRLCVSIDPAVVVVGDGETKDDPFLENVEQTLKLLQQEDPSNTTTLLQYLQKSPLLLPKCYVSRSAYETVAMVDSLLHDVLERIRDKGADDTLLTSAIDAVRDTVSLFLLLRSSLNRDQLYKNASSAAVFYCDLLFISRRMLLLLPKFEKKIPRHLQFRQHQFTLLDLVNTMHPVQEEVFNTMLLLLLMLIPQMHHREQLLNLCNALGPITQLSLDREYMAAEARIGDIVQELKTLIGCWTSILPSDLTARCIARLLDAVLANILSQICSEIDSTTRLSLPNANALSFLLASTRDQLVPLLQIISEQYPVDTFTETWNAFCLFKELIDADVPQFIARKREIRERLSLKQVQTILAINGRKTLPAQEILELILTGDSV